LANECPSSCSAISWALPLPPAKTAHDPPAPPYFASLTTANCMSARMPVPARFWLRTVLALNVLIVSSRSIPDEPYVASSAVLTKMPSSGLSAPDWALTTSILWTLKNFA
jgi:hypothetical protein